MERFFKTGKKTLAVFMAVIMLMTAWVFAVPAADAESEITPCAENEHNWVLSMKVEPTCTQDGYEIWVCSKCTSSERRNFVQSNGHVYDDGVHIDATCTVPAGTLYTCVVEGCGENERDHKLFVTDKDSEPLGHDMSSWKPEAQENGAYYYYKRNCSREGCAYFEYEMKEGSTTEKQKYYKVEFINDYATDETEVAADGTVLASKHKSVVLDTQYAKENGEAVYSKVAPKQDKDKEFGKYVFEGWYDADGKSALDLTNVTENTTAHAKFKGIVMVYRVIFNGYSADEQQKITYRCSATGNVFALNQEVCHGQTIAVNPAKDITFSDGSTIVPSYDTSNLNYRYTYKNWDLAADDALTQIPIYSDHYVYPVFIQTPKTYKAVFHYNNKYYAGGDWYTVSKDDLTFDEFFGYATDISDAVAADLDDVGVALDKKAVDNTYNYEFDGWVDENGAKVSLSSLTVPAGTSEYNPALDGMEYILDKDRGIIQLYPSYIRRSKEYKAIINVIDIDGRAAVGASVQVTGSNGFLCAPVVKTDANGQAVITLSYDVYYKVTAALNGNSGETTIVGYGEAGLAAMYNAYLAGEIKQLPTYDLRIEYKGGVNGEQSECHCICHSFLGRLHIRILNIVYNLFGRKIVCCPDMYATHGDMLAYGAN